MSIRLVIGRAGSGKTRHCFDAIVEAMRRDPLGPAIYWILPKQATFQAERELTCASGLGAFCRARVLSFELLGEEILEGCGGAAAPEVSALGRQMLLGHLLRKNQSDLRFFKSVARQPGLAARLDTTFAELERCGKDPQMLAEFVAQLQPANEEDIESRLLLDKIADFHLLYKAYRDALGNERVDPQRRIEQVLKCLHNFKPLKSAAVYVDGFLEFTERERRMLVGLAQACPHVEVTILANPASATIADVHHLPDDFALFHRTERTYRQLYLAMTEAGVAIEEPVFLTHPRRFEDAAIAEIERTLFGDALTGEPSPRPFPGVPGEGQAQQSIELVEAPDRRGEVDAVARRIREMTREGGPRLRDVGVLVRDLGDYHELIGASFKEHDIPFFADRRRTAAHHPLLQFTRSVFLIARNHWPHEAVMTLLKSGLAGITPDEADELENYVLLHRIRGGGWTQDEPWSFSRALTRGGEEELPPAERIEVERMDRLRRRVVDCLQPFVESFRAGAPREIRQIVVDLFKLYERFGVARTLAEWIEQATAANDLEQRGEHEQVWVELTKLFDQLVDLLGEERVELADLVEILESGLEQFDLALAPPRVDQVLVGQVDRTRTPRLHTLFLVGLSEGQFPKIEREDSVLSDAERRSLRKKNLDVDPDSERKLLDENLLGYIGLTRASRRLIVTRAVASEDNKPLGPSAFWNRLRRTFPELESIQEQRGSDAAADAIGTPRQLVTALMRWARAGSENCASVVAGDRSPLSPALSPEYRGEGEKALSPALYLGYRGEGVDQEQAPWPALYHWLATRECCLDNSDAIDVMRFKAWRALGYANEAKLSAETAAKLHGCDLHASVTRIETFATCPFRHFLRYDLSLREREEADVTAMDLGNVYHHILERCMRETLAERKDWCELEPQVTQRMIGEFSEEIGQTLRGELMLSTARNKYLLQRAARTLERVVATQREVLRRGDFRPAFAELEFGIGEASALPAFAIKTPKGRRVLLHGKIDRVDLARDGSEVAVIDYKMSDHRLALANVYYGLSLQLLTYLLVLEASGEKLLNRKIRPVAAFYSRLLRWLESVKHPEEALDPDDPRAALSTKPRGIFDARYVNKLDAGLTEGASQVVHAFVKQDGAFGKLDSTDVAEGAAFAGLLKFVQRRIGELADEMIGGAIGVRPYRMGRTTPCPNCEYRSVCRFDAGINQYLMLEPMKRSEVLKIIVEGGESGA